MKQRLLPFNRRLRHTIATITVTVCIAVLSFSAGNKAYSADKSRVPNIVLIIADDLGYGELGCYGGQEIPTPHLNALAARGVRFTNGYVTAPFCAASRAGLLTGRYQTRFGFEFNPIGPQNADPAIGLPRGQPTLGDHLRKAGYATALIGKWHLGGTAAYHPQRRGFDEFFGFLHEGHFYTPLPYADHVTWLRRTALPDGQQGRWTSPDERTIWSTHMGHREPDYDADNPILRSSQPVDEQANLTDAFTREACAFIKRHEAQPFFLCLAYNAVHSPLQATDPYLKRFEHLPDIQRRIFAAMLAHLDDSLGVVQKQLEQSKLSENTLVVFLSDNGGPTKELTSSNAPLRGGKGDLYDGGIRVPMMIAFPGKIPAGIVTQSPVNALDLSATMLASGEAKNPQSDGINLLPYLTAETPALPDRALYWRVGNKHALRHNHWKLVRDTRNSEAWQLYDLHRDIGETIDLASDQPQQLQELSSLWERWNAEQVAPLWK